MRNIILPAFAGLLALTHLTTPATAALLTAEAAAGAYNQTVSAATAPVLAYATTTPWATAQASAEYGLLRASGSTTGQITSAGGSPVIQGDGISRFDDVFTIDSPSHAWGAPATLTLLYRVEGDVSAGEHGGGIRATSTMALKFRAYQWQSLIKAADHSYSVQAASGLHTFGTDFRGTILAQTFDVMIGIPITMLMQLEARTFMEPINVRAETVGSSAFAIADLGHTFTWLGFESLTVGGVAVTGYTVSSNSGTNWAAPVPEPAALLPLAATALLIRRRRRG
jgi:hypothetical protein